MDFSVKADEQNLVERDMKISIAMATYNGAEYLSEQLQSLGDLVSRISHLTILREILHTDK